ncbi:unnamed protein product [Calicophoron daubneyi]|uniref:Rho-GAP domain-containing protein n=1 Tax=Calicophoron daubneyi TaxID=300641 RepID=A0AAV2T4S5_CALDB
MGRLSIFSWDGADNVDAFQKWNDREYRKSSLKVKKSPNILSKRCKPKNDPEMMLNALFRPSVILLDPLPEPPSGRNPYQRCINPLWQRPITQMGIRITAMGEVKDFPEHDLPPDQLGQQMSMLIQRKESEKIEPDGTHSRKTSKKRAIRQERFWLGDLQLCDFRPLEPPYVPYMVRMLVVKIEESCATESWAPVYESTKGLRKEGKENAMRLIKEFRNVKNLQKLIDPMPLPIRIATLRAFLDAFSSKPLHMSKAVVKRLVKKPLYDQFLRANAEVKSIIRQIVLPQTRTNLDTLAFLMVHLIHALEAASNPLATRAKLSEIYGPLLISFSERPVIMDRDVSPNKTEECVLMELILDVCDKVFWDDLTMLTVDHAFSLEIKRVSRTKRKPLATAVIPLPSADAINKIWSEFVNKSPSGHRAIRPTAEILREVGRYRTNPEWVVKHLPDPEERHWSSECLDPPTRESL